MKKEIKNFGKYLEITLIILTFISLILAVLVNTNIIYNATYDTLKLNNIVTNSVFNIFLWIDNILIYLISIFYIIDTIKEKKNVFLKISFSIFSICTTLVVSTLIINGVAKIFGIF